MNSYIIYQIIAGTSTAPEFTAPECTAPISNTLSYSDLDNINYSENQYSYIYITGQFFSIFSIGFFIAILIVSNFMKNDLIEDTNEDEKHEYSLKYYDDFEELEELDHTNDFLLSLKNKYINEITPVGTIIMTYNYEYGSFWYYAQSRSINYHILDAVAQKFAIENNCKSICVNYRTEYFKGKETAEERDRINKENQLIIKEDTENKKKMKNVFATLKSYNMLKKNEPEKSYILTETANRFTFKGFINDWEDPNEIIDKKDKQKNKIKQLNFETFKNMKQ